MKRIILFGLIIVLPLLIIACSDDDEPIGYATDYVDNNFADPNLSIVDIWADHENIIGLPTGEYTYVRSEIQVGNDVTHISTVTAHNGVVYGVSVTRSEDRSLRSSFQFFSVDMDTEEVTFYPQPMFAGDKFFLQTNIITANTAGITGSPASNNCHIPIVIAVAD